MLRSLWLRFSDAARFYAKGLGARLKNPYVVLWAQAIAFKVLVTLLPLLVLGTGILGLVMRQEDPFDAVSRFLGSFLPNYQSDTLFHLLGQLQQAGSTITIVGGVGLFLTVLTLFSALRVVISGAFGGDRHEQRPLLRGYLFDLRMVGQVALLFLLSFGITVGLRGFMARSHALAEQYGLDAALVSQGWEGVLGVAAWLVPLVLSVAMYMQLYYFIPQPKPPSRSAFAGAAFAALLFEGAKNLFAYYAVYVGRFDRYEAPNPQEIGRDLESGSVEGASDALISLGGFFGLILALVFWVYLSGLILILGAMVAAVHEERTGPRRSRLRRVLARRFGADAEDEGVAESDEVAQDGRAAAYDSDSEGSAAGEAVEADEAVATGKPAESSPEPPASSAPVAVSERTA
ncbi:MAG: YihY/virulence factor BrkB family protein [Bacteroidota bacterium]